MRLGRTFGNKCVSVCAGEGAVNLADQLHVVEEGVEGIEVGEAHHVGGTASCSLKRDPESVIPSVRGWGGLQMDFIVNDSSSLKNK